MTAPSTDELTGSTDAKAMNRCLLRNLDEANATISALRKAAEGMAEALDNARLYAPTGNDMQAIYDALAAYEATK